MAYWRFLSLYEEILVDDVHFSKLIDVNPNRELFKSIQTNSKRSCLSNSLSQLLAITFKTEYTKMLETGNQIITQEIYCTINKANMRKRYIVSMQVCFMGTPMN